jgi:MFS family permease
MKNELVASLEDEDQLVNKAMWRLLPLVALCYLAAVIDRGNVGFAKLQMVADLRMTEQQYALGASCFFIGYVFCEIPSSLAVHRFGARIWFIRIMLTWAIANFLIAFVLSGVSFTALRLLLGIAEAGLFPGALYFLTLWFPQRYQVRAVALLQLGSPIGQVVSALTSGPLLDFNGILGLAGWQWVFIGTSIPPLLLVFAIYFWLPDKPSDAKFLSPHEKAQLDAAVARDKRGHVIHGNPLAALWDHRVLFFALIYSLILTALYGVIYWLPTVIRGFNVSGTQNGILTAIPWGLSACALLCIPTRLGEKRRITLALAATAMFGAAAFFLSFALSTNSQLYVALSLGTPAITVLIALFWSMPSRFFTGARAAASIAAISTLGNLGGFFAPNLMPWANQVTGRAVGSMLVPGACLAVIGMGAVLFWMVTPPVQVSRT